ncbi:hypothetical protein BJV74DRAFT_954783, partial [Russula compacta]
MSGSMSSAVDIGNTYGATFIGLILNSILYGVTIVQTLNARAILSVLDTVHTAVCTYMLYWYLIKNFADVENLDIDNWSNKVQLTLNSFVASMVQLFYARRLYLMSHNIALVAIIVVLTAFVFTMGFVFSIRQSMLKLYSRDNSLIWVTCVGM